MARQQPRPTLQQQTQKSLIGWPPKKGSPNPARSNLPTILSRIYKALGVIPSQQKIVLERFFDESGGMQLVIHSPFGIRVNRAWGLALRKRFCRSFNFELQAAATDDAIVLSLGTQHSFPLDEVFRYLNSKTVRDLLVQALLDAPMFPIRWRWNATRALALPRLRGGRKVAAPLAANGIGKPPGRGLSRPARLPGEYRRRPRRFQTIRWCGRPSTIA